MKFVFLKESVKLRETYTLASKGMNYNKKEWKLYPEDKAITLAPCEVVNMKDIVVYARIELRKNSRNQFG